MLTGGGDFECPSAVLRDSIAAFSGTDPDDVNFTVRLGCRPRAMVGCCADGLRFVYGGLTGTACMPCDAEERLHQTTTERAGQRRTLCGEAT
jgi:hypothetical protein